MSQLATDRSTLVGRDFIETLDWTVEEIDETLAVAGELKAAFRNGEPDRLLPDKTLFMLFLDKSTRTRNAFESGMTQLGGHANVLFGVALLASGLSSSSVGTLAGQVVMQGFIRRQIPIFVRRAVTMLPAFVVIGLGIDPSRRWKGWSPPIRRTTSPA